MPDEAALRSVCALLDRERVPYAPFREPDRDNELTAVATGPVYGPGRGLFRRFPLLKDPSAAPPPPAALAGDAARSFSGGLTVSDDSISGVTYPTRFGMFAACDRETYRKLKRIRHLAGFAEAECRRWNRSQRRLPHNRVFKRRRGGKVVRELVSAERMIFAQFFEFGPVDPAPGWPGDARVARGTQLLARFYADYGNARKPKVLPAEVVPLKLSPAEVDDLLGRIELWNLRR